MSTWTKSDWRDRFGDHTGYYSLADYYPVFHIECITHRKDAIYPATIVGKPPMEDCYLGKATERIFLPILRLFMPEIVDMNLPLEGVFHNCAVVSIKKRYPGQAKNYVCHLGNGPDDVYQDDHRCGRTCQCTGHVGGLVESIQ